MHRFVTKYHIQAVKDKNKSRADFINVSFGNFVLQINMVSKLRFEYKGQTFFLVLLVTELLSSVVCRLLRR